ncbi:MAG: helix-hairpin-helix domain-containing protein [Bacteroidales bacterium]|nr:helix-hairpin-helix domain-containing protein [Bacteroidales bacterium]
MPPKLSGTKDFLTFSKGERNGIIILIILILILLFSPMFYKSFVNPIPSKNQKFYTQADSFFLTLKAKPEDVTKKVNPIENEEIKTNASHSYFFFDPNKVTVDEMVQLGLSIKQANVIDKYRCKGGLFHTPKDFSKIYVIDSSIYKKLKPWIKINEFSLELKSKIKNDSLHKSEETPIIVELNAADTLELAKIKGIGKVFARRIIAYRNLLGGYVNINQLNEVYGIKSELVNSISSQITIDSTKIKLINLNLISFEDIKKHPYISEYQAKAIIYYRSKVGNIKKIHELLENKILPADKYRNARSYLTTY